MAETMNVRLPDGTVLTGIPVGTTREQIADKLRANGLAVPQENTWGQAARNVGEAGLQLATSLPASVAGNAAGLAAIPVHALGEATDNAMNSPDMPQAARGRYDALRARIARDNASGTGPQGMDPTQVRQAVTNGLTYEPYNPDSLTSKALSLPGRAIGAAGDFLRDTTDKATGGVPYVGNLAGAVPEIAANLLGVKGVKGARARAAEAPVPSAEALHGAAREAYKKAEQSGHVVPADVVNKTLDDIKTMARDNGLDAELHPKATRILARLEESRGKPLTFTEADTLRKVANSVAGDVNPGSFTLTADANIARGVIEHLDDAMESLPHGAEARTLWSRYRRADMLDEMGRKAQIKAGANYTNGGLEAALRGEFRALATNTKRMRMFTEAQRAAIEKVAKGGPMENLVRVAGKLAPTGPLPIAAGVGAGAVIGGGAGAAVMPAAMVAREGAKRMTMGNVAKAREALVGRGLPGQAPPTVGAGVGARPAAISQAFAAGDPNQTRQDVYQFMRGRGTPNAGASRGLMLATGRGEEPAPMQAEEVFAQIGLKPGPDGRISKEQIDALINGEGGDYTQLLIDKLRRGKKGSKLDRMSQLSGPELDAYLEQFMTGRVPR